MTFHTLRDFELKDVVITDSYLKNSLEKEILYLKRFEEDRLVAGFRETKGLTPKAPKYPGWESTEIRGHTMGHYLTAVSQAYATTSDKEILDKILYLVNELKECQFESGYLSAFPETFFDNVETNQPCWVPWYTMDKIIAGLTAVYKFTGNETAFDIVKKLGLWVYDRTAKWTDAVQNTVLAVEYGGMNECMYELYKYSGDERHAQAAHKFDEIALFTPIHEGNDILNGKHANTTIPKFLGSLERYISLGQPEEEKFYFEAAKKFWDLVVDNHSYVTGGNSEWEHFGEPRILDAERTNCNCETCNTYNMLKLSRELFKLTGEKKYVDFYENTFINAIMSSQNPETGMTMYFQPMATGYFKVYSTDFHSFWCCTGTGLENFTKLNDSIYFKGEDEIYVNQFISSSLIWKDKNIRLTQESQIPDKDKTIIKIQTLDDKPVSFKLFIRKPDWAAGAVTLKVNGEGYDAILENDFFVIDRLWSDDDRVEVTIPMKISAYPLHDNAHVIGLKYGPVVLSAAMGTDDLMESKTGVDVTIATRNLSMKDFITIPEGSVEDWIALIEQNVVKDDDKLEFRLVNTDEGSLVFTPHYRQHKERYGIYWNVVSKDSKALQKHILTTKDTARRTRIEIDSIPLGNDQYELQHNIQGENTGAATFNGLMLRHAWGIDGWFSYDMKVDPSVQNHLLAKYFSPNAGRTFNIYIDGELLLEETIEDLIPGDFYDKWYPIPAEMINGKDKINVKFVTRGDSFVGGMFDRLSIVKNYDSSAELKSLVFDKGELSEPFNPFVTDYLLKVPKDTAEVVMKATLGNENGLLYIGNILIDDSASRVINLVGEKTTVLLTVKAEDHTTEKQYCVTILK